MEGVAEDRGRFFFLGGDRSFQGILQLQRVLEISEVKQ